MTREEFIQTCTKEELAVIASGIYKSGMHYAITNKLETLPEDVAILTTVTRWLKEEHDQV